MFLAFAPAGAAVPKMSDLLPPLLLGTNVPQTCELQPALGKTPDPLSSVRGIEVSTEQQFKVR